MYQRCTNFPSVLFCYFVCIFAVGKLINKQNIDMQVKCKIVGPLTNKYKEFPELLFGSSEKNIIYFDATLYIEQKDKAQSHSVTQFINSFSFWLKGFCDAYQMQKDEMVIIDSTTNHVMIEHSMALLFVCYIDPMFGVYLLERVEELLLDGVVISDSYLMHLVVNRLTKESITKILNDNSDEKKSL